MLMHKFDRIEMCMGTGFRFQGQSELEAGAVDFALQTACGILHEADSIFSLYETESWLSKLATGKVSLADCPPVVSEIWDACELWEERTDGWFSAFTPQHTFDPSGLVKTWAAKQAADSLIADGVVDFTVNAGGDIYISDLASGDLDFRVGLSRPVSIASAESGALSVLDLSGTPFRAVATSGSAERGNHIWNPKAAGREFATELVQMTVIAADLVEADVWATAAFAEGLESMSRLDGLGTVEAFCILADGQIAATPGFAGLMTKG